MAYCIDNEQKARVLLESGKLDIQKMKGIEKFVENAEDGSIRFEFTSWVDNRFRVIMNSPTSLQSITRI